jgi:hypothetical protein
MTEHDTRNAKISRASDCKRSRIEEAKPQPSDREGLGYSAMNHKKWRESIASKAYGAYTLGVGVRPD